MTVLLVLILAPFTLLTFCFAVELFVGMRPLRQPKPRAALQARAAIIVPAHDEEAIIAESLAELNRAAAGQAKILLVADNCSDSTAEIARSLGVEVVERFDPELRGKGYALDFARTALRQNPPNVVLIIDADCSAEAASIGRLIQRCVSTGSPCQAVYLQRPAPAGPPTLQLSTFAFYIKNLVRQRALQRLAGRVHLLGTGIALPWSLFERADLATGNIVEDLEMGLELADAGHRPLLVEDAAVWSEPASAHDTFDQRRRWEGGYLESAAKWAPRIFVRSLFRRDPKLLWSALNLLIPPFTLLVLVDLAALLLSIMAVWLGGFSPWPSLLLASSILFAGIGVVIAAMLSRPSFISLRGMIRIPVYLLWKIPLYLGFARRGAPKEWMRTRRG